MNRVREVIRLHETAGLSIRRIAKALGVSRPVVDRYLRPARYAELGWAEVEPMDDEEVLEQLEAPTPRAGGEGAVELFLAGYPGRGLIYAEVTENQRGAPWWAPPAHTFEYAGGAPSRHRTASQAGGNSHPGIAGRDGLQPRAQRRPRLGLPALIHALGR